MYILDGPRVILKICCLVRNTKDSGKPYWFKNNANVFKLIIHEGIIKTEHYFVIKIHSRRPTILFYITQEVSIPKNVQSWPF